MSRVQLITSTPDAEKSMAYIARVSNPKNQENPFKDKPNQLNERQIKKRKRMIKRRKK